MYCPKCGKKLPDSAKFCDECGANLQGIVTPETQNNNEVPNIGLIIYIIVSLTLLFWAIHTYSNDTSQMFGGYNYRFPLTGHESVVVIVGMLGLGGMWAGIAVLCSPKLKNSNQPDVTKQRKPKAGEKITAQKLPIEGYKSLVKCSHCGELQGAKQTSCTSCGAKFIE